jgi:glutathione S-transferase
LPARLYFLSLSHPSQAARLMLERKGIEHKLVNILPGSQPVVVRLVGFRGITVPALRIEGRRIQGSREISLFLDELVPEPPLFPRDPEQRRAVEAAERWGEETLQPVPRRIFRWGAARHRYVRRWIAADVVGLPLPGLVASANAPVARKLATMAAARDDAVRGDLGGVPDLIARVDALVADGTIGGDEPNAADFQIGTTVRVLLAFADLRRLVEGRPAADLARRILPAFPSPIPSFLPPGWL